MPFESSVVWECSAIVEVTIVEVRHNALDLEARVVFPAQADHELHKGKYRTCETASVWPCMGRTEPGERGIQSICFLNTPVMVPCCSGPDMSF